MRHLPNGVCVVTFGQGDARTGVTATSVSSLSVEPPTMLVSVDRASSSYAALARSRAFGVNVLASEHQDVADRFAGRGGDKGSTLRRAALVHAEFRRLAVVGRSRRL